MAKRTGPYIITQDVKTGGRVFQLNLTELPPTLNEIIETARRNRYGSASVKRRWTERIARYCEGACRFRGQVYVEFVWHLRNFSRDADNTAAAAKYIMDGLVEANVIKEDNLRIIGSPVVHWYQRAVQDGVSVYIYNHRAYSQRRKELQESFLPPR